MNDLQPVWVTVSVHTTSEGRVMYQRGAGGWRVVCEGGDMAVEMQTAQPTPRHLRLVGG
ncbi:hypothetical protein [Mycolicibacterium brisbanense]